MQLFIVDYNLYIDNMSFIKTMKSINCVEYVIYIALLIGSLAYLWDVFTLFEAKETSMKVKEIRIMEQPTIIITTNEDNGHFGRHIDGLQDIKLTYSTYRIRFNTIHTFYFSL